MLPENSLHVLVHTEQPNLAGHIQSLTFTVQGETNKSDSRVYHSRNVCDFSRISGSYIASNICFDRSFKLQ